MVEHFKEMMSGAVPVDSAFDWHRTLDFAGF